jgi:ankyrin repeat protein
LTLAAEYGYEDVVRLLLSGEADTNMCDQDGDTALIVAACMGHENVLKVLLASRRLNLAHKNKKGYNALLRAMEQGHQNLVELLLPYYRTVQ